MFIRRIFLGLPLLLTLCATSQPTGYLGKKMLLKTNVINGIRMGFNGADLEYVAGRRMSFTFAFQKFNYNRSAEGITRKTGIIVPRNGYCKMMELSTLSKGNSRGWTASVSTKIYFDNILPAPLGYYTEISLGFGKAELSGYNISYDYKETSLSSCQLTEPNLPLRSSLNNLGGSTNILLLEAPSIGYQRAFGKFIMIDIKASLLNQYCNLPENILNAFEHNYFVRSNTIGYGIGPFSVGLNLYAKFGVALF